MTALAQGLVERLAVVEKIIRPTPVIQLTNNPIDLFTKLEYLNGIGSVKDRPALWTLKRAIERGEIESQTTIIESSSGNFACAIATLAKMLEINFIPVIDPNISPLYESWLRSQCDRVIKVENHDNTGGFLKSRLCKVQQLKSEISDSYWPNQYANPDCMEAHYHLTGEEIWRSIPSIDYVFLGVSSAGTIAGVSQRLKEHNANIRIVAVDVEGSVIFRRSLYKRWISGLGSSIIPPLLKHALIDEVVLVSEVETIAGCHELLEKYGLFVGGSSGSAYSAIKKYFAKLNQRTRPRVLFLCCDRGNAYLNNIFNRRWVEWRVNAIDNA
jgi:2,3-diaminopropionate biosynthesis protein SbnA